MFKFLKYLPLLLIIMSGCSTSRHSADVSYALDPVEIRPDNRVYQHSAKRDFDLLHTKLEVGFDWEKQYLNGKATLSLKPYFYDASELILDAKGFELKQVGLIGNGNLTALTYDYDSIQIRINLEKNYSRNDTISIFIEYVAKPNELDEGGSSAIISDKGLYFINPLGAEENKPRQIWTQGETEASSCWFPTIDKPNERCTQEISITVADSLVTLSNGLLVSSTKNTDGTRTDYWKQDLPHAPYLFMMGVGEFAVVKDEWNNMDVEYYVEPEFEPYARDIFGNTPEMLDFYSNILDYKYPWAKYSQIPVRDFVSGAMENTTATVFFDAIQKTKQEMIDGDYEYIIAHELFHHWFGDLVTCESWANLPLNEAFATYGEYLWIEYKYGKDEADQHAQSNLEKYLMEAQISQKRLIRYYYDDKEDMFDAHSYDKGGLILHMLRNHLGDEAFFKGLNVYLTENEYQSVEVHDLRLAFEKVSGEDLNWYFNQWFFFPGHPELTINYEFDDQAKKALVTIEQTQNKEDVPKTYELPIAIDIYQNGEIDRNEILVNEPIQTFEFKVSAKPDLINVDSDKILVCSKKDNKSFENFSFQYYNAPLFLDQYEAIKFLADEQNKDVRAIKVLTDALKDDFWGIRKLAVEKIEVNENTKPLLAKISLQDEKSRVRAAAIQRLDILEDEEYLEVFKKALSDSSYLVVSSALEAIFNLDENQAFTLAQQYEGLKNYRITSAVGNIYAEKGQEDKQPYFEKKVKEVKGYARYNILTDYGNYLKKKNEYVVRQGLKTLEDVASNAGSWWDRFAATASIHNLKKDFDGYLNGKPDSALDYNEEQLALLVQDIDRTLESIIAQETNLRLLNRYKAFN